MKKHILWTVGVVAIVAILIAISLPGKKQTIQPLNIGVVTALTGDFAFYGESTRVGVELAQKDLRKEGINAQFIFEDGQTDATKALNAAQKLVDVDGVSGIYSEFTPGAIAISSFVKGKNVLHVYDASPVSPLVSNPLVYKTYIDYIAGCRMVAEYLKRKGVKSVGVLQANAEFGELCAQGVRSVFGPSVFAETYNIGTTDFRTPLLKLRQHNVEVVFNPSFPTETITSIKEIRELGLKIPFVAESDAFSSDTLAENSGSLGGVITFGLPHSSPEFERHLKEELPDQKIGYIDAAALGYIHARQIARALSQCDDDVSCVQNKMDNAASESIIGFGGFQNHVAQFTMPIQEFRNGRFETVMDSGE